MSGGPQPHMIPIVPGVPGLTGRTPLAERVERHMADKEDPHGTMVMVNEAIRGFIKNEADPLFSDWLAKHNDIGTHTRDTNNPHKVTAAQVGALSLVEDSNRVKTAVTIGSRKGRVGTSSLANGNDVTASGYHSHAEGYNTASPGSYSHAEGRETTASGDYSHTEGFRSQTKVNDNFAYSWNGDGTRTKPYFSHGEGTFNVNPVGGTDGFYIGEKKLSEVISDGVANKADKATTLAGYGITDAATKTELDAVDQRAVNGIFGVQSELSKKADLVGGKVPAAQLPAFVDDVLEYDAMSAFPATGEDGKIYVAKNTNKTYRWGGTQYVEISPSLALGETSETAYPGDKGAANASAVAALKKSKQDALNAQQLSAVNSGVTAEKISNMVTKDGVVPKGDGTEVIATIGGKDIKIPPATDPVMISDSAGNVVHADGSAVVVDGSWTCNGVVLTKKEGRDDYWENTDKKWGLGYTGDSRWALAVETGQASTTAPADATKLSFVIGGVTYNATIGRTDSVVMASDVESTKRYSVVRPEASGNTYQLSDFAVNVVDLPSSGEYTFTFPPRTGGRVRDFVLKLNVTADPLPTVQFVKHPTDNDPPRFEGADGWSELELGVNFFGFTETS